jgi:membrane-associated phospholipid phosphatase
MWSAISGLLRTLPHFPKRNWAARWNAWLVLDEFVDKTWKPAAKTTLDARLTAATANQATEIQNLVLADRDERAQALGEILAQEVEFISAFMGLLTITPGSHPYTYRILHIASLIGSFAALHFKGVYNRARPSQVCPALLPPIPVPGHSSFPSGHSTQAHLMQRCVTHVLTEAGIPQTDLDTLTADLWVLAERVARNREIAGLHYESDSIGGTELSAILFGVLTNTSAPLATFDLAVSDAANEW